MMITVMVMVMVMMMMVMCVTVEHPRSLANAHFLNLLKPFAKVLGSDLFHTIISSFLYATHILSTHLKFHTPYTF